MGLSSWEDQIQSMNEDAAGPLIEDALPMAVPGDVTPNQWYAVNEDERVYQFAGGDIFIVPDVRRVFVSSRDTHYLRNTSNTLFIVRNNWISISITEMEDPT